MSSTGNRDLATECLSKMVIDIDRLLNLNTFGRVTSQDDITLLIEHAKIREQSVEHQHRLVPLWIDADKDARFGCFKNPCSMSIWAQLLMKGLF